MANKTRPQMIDAGDKSVIINGKIITMGPDTYPSSILKLDGLTIVLFLSHAKGLSDSNIRAYDDNGILVWCVEPAGSTSMAGVFISWKFNESIDAIVLHSWNGYFYVLDHRTGSIKRLDWEPGK